VVYRGNKELDGIVSRNDDRSLTEIICQLLKESKHYGQVRLILIDEKTLPEPISTETIWETTGKPVLAKTVDRVFDPRYMIQYKGNIFSATGIDEGSVRRVLKMIYGDSGPEALRISSIILRSIATFQNV
jgi:endonuclease V-like protein UPF0215 family